MRLTVLGATGGTGRQVVRQALAAGHQVTAMDPPTTVCSDGIATVLAAMGQAGVRRIVVVSAAPVAHYRTAADAGLPRGFVVSRADLAAAMLAAAGDPALIGHAVAIAR